MIVYFFIALLATTFGSLVGLGGGVVIKPVLDSIGTYDIATIGILSSITVFSMAIVSTIKQIRKGFVVERIMIAIVVGAVLGGGIGNFIFKNFMILIGNERYASAIQSGILAFLLSLVLLKNYLPKYHIKNKISCFFIGMTLGTLSSFLGVGGGPINILILVLFLNMDMKKSAITSILIILFSQFSKLILILLSEGFGGYDLNALYVMVPGGILGGFIGAYYNHKLSFETIIKVFNVAILMLIIMNIYNLINALS